MINYLMCFELLVTPVSASYDKLCLVDLKKHEKYCFTEELGIGLSSFLSENKDFRENFLCENLVTTKIVPKIR